MKQYKNLTQDRFNQLNQMRDRLLNQIGLDTLKNMCLNNKELVNPLMHDSYYFISVSNPFANPYKASSMSFDEWMPCIESWGDYLFFKSTMAPEENKIITCIGIADTSNKQRIWLCNEANLPSPCYIEYRPDIKYPGWYFVCHTKEYYKVYVPKSSGYNSKNLLNPQTLLHPTNEKTNFMYSFIKEGDLIIKNLNNIKDEWPKFLEVEKAKQIEKEKMEAEEKQRKEEELKIKKQKEEYAALKAEMEDKKYKEFFKDYTYIGHEAPGSKFPQSEFREIYQKVKNDPNFKWETYYAYSEEIPGNRGQIFNGTLYNPKYKIYMTYSGDSTD